MQMPSDWTHLIRFISEEDGLQHTYRTIESRQLSEFWRGLFQGRESRSAAY